MRLGQLARKLELTQAEIVQFLATKNISVEDDPNTKVDENHVAMVFQNFAPETSSENIPTANTPTVDEEVVESVAGEAQTPEPSVEAPEKDASMERSDLIKAPKVELSGLKVVGKIDLPEPRKKPEEAAGEIPPSERTQSPKGEKRPPNRKKPQRPAQNPIALQREREALEAQKKREEDFRLKKEKRTQNYLRKVKAHQPTKAAKLIREEAESMTAVELAEPPKTWWGKFVKWLTT